MSFTGRLIESRYSRKRQKTGNYPISSSKMASFALQPKAQYLNLPLAPLRKGRQHMTRSRDEIDDFSFSDLETSFASTVSLNSPPGEMVSLAPDNVYADPMDISPGPPLKSTVSRLFSIEKDAGSRQPSRPRAYTSGARLFGNDLSNRNSLMPSPTLVQAPSLKSAGLTHSKKIQRSALPTEWFTSSQESVHHKSSEPSSLTDDAMDVDTSYDAEQPPSSTFSTCLPLSSAPTITGFNILFFDTTSPRRSLDSPAHRQLKKRRSFSPEPVRSFEVQNSSSPMPLDPLPSQPKPNDILTSSLSNRLNKPTLQGLGVPSSSFLKRPRRPIVSAMVPLQPIQSAFPVLSSAGIEEDTASARHSPPVRRAFSALIPTSNFLESISDESSFDGPDMSSPAQAYSKRQQVKTLRRCDGTEDFRPLTGGAAITLKDSPSARLMAAGLPGFGDNEAHGKILPCHRVREDGLMRISSRTLDNLLDGQYDSQIVDYHILDCRFDYEYAGGHIPGAVNVNTTAAVEELLLGPSLTKPRPSISGDSVKKTILVFHCEFSAKRGPTFAKDLRAKDRAMNNHVYPKIHFPEIYILEGGYCQYYKTSAHRCEPHGYVTMDDPTHAASRREDLDQFRKAKFGRHKSYTYGDGLGKPILSQQVKRNTAPSGGSNPVFAAANAARTRRGGLMTLPEDNSASADAEDTDTDIGDSPCPPPTKGATFKGKKVGRVSLVRAETYNPIRMAY